MQSVAHEKAICQETNSWYGGSTARAHSGHWKLEFTCPVCTRTGKFLANYLGQRTVSCDGIRFIKEDKCKA